MLERISAALNRWIEGLLFLLGFSMALVVALQVVFRYGLNQSLFWSEELARYLLVWLTFLGASVAYRRGIHPGIDLFPARTRPWLRKAAALLVHLAAISFFGVMLVSGCRFAFFVRAQISPALQIPKWIVYSIVPASGLVLLVHALAILAAEWKGAGRER